MEQLETAVQEKGVETRPLLLGSQNSRRGKKKLKLFWVMYIINNFPFSTDFTGLLPLSIKKIPDSSLFYTFPYFLNIFLETNIP